MKLKYSMKKRTKISLVIILSFTGLIIFANSIPLIIGKGNCPKPLTLAVVVKEPTNYSLALTEPKFREIVSKAISEWETKTKMNLFQIIEPSSSLNKSGLINTITLIPKDYTKLDLEERQLAGWTITQTMGHRVSNFSIEVYEPSPLLIYQVVLHELGHARGLVGHSSNPDDVMFLTTSYTKTNLTDADSQSLLNYCNTN